MGEWAELGWFVALAAAGSVPGATRPRPAPETAPAARTVAQVRGVLAERVVVSTALDPYLTLRALVSYSGIGLRRLDAFLTDPAHPLPHYRVGGKVLVRVSEFDGWIMAYRARGETRVNAIVDDVVRALRAD